jgi:hypothetical protein
MQLAVDQRVLAPDGDVRKIVTWEFSTRPARKSQHQARGAPAEDVWLVARAWFA